jgi:hypothetical protein
MILDAGDGMILDAGDGMILDAGDGMILDAGDGMILDACRGGVFVSGGGQGQMEMACFRAIPLNLEGVIINSRIQLNYMQQLMIIPLKTRLD